MLNKTLIWITAIWCSPQMFISESGIFADFGHSNIAMDKYSIWIHFLQKFIHFFLDKLLNLGKMCLLDYPKLDEWEKHVVFH